MFESRQNDGIVTELIESDENKYVEVIFTYLFNFSSVTREYQVTSEVATVFEKKTYNLSADSTGENKSVCCQLEVVFVKTAEQTVSHILPAIQIIQYHRFTITHTDIQQSLFPYITTLQQLQM